MRPISLHAVWGVQNGTTGPISGVRHRPNHPCFSYETGLTCRLTDQGQKWEAALKYRVTLGTFRTPDATADVSADRRRKAMDEPVRWVTKAEAAEELEISFSTLDRMVRKGEVEVRREGRRVFVRMEGPEYISDEELLRRAVAREQELERTVQEMEQRVSELERERDEARESAATARQPFHELEREHRKEVAGHKETKEALIAVRVAAFVLLALLIASVLLWWFVLR